ncbi:MAG: site-specific integrase [Spirochaetia bacterium]|jgi:integrase
MERKPYILYRRASGGNSGKIYYVAFWNIETRNYTNRRSTNMTSNGAADNQARKWLAEGLPARDAETFIGYLEGFWANGSQYLAGREARLKPLSATYVINSRSAIAKYVKPWLVENGKEKLPLSGVTAGLLESLTLHLREKGLGPSRINGIVKAIRVPLSNASKMGRIRENPARQVEKLPDPAPKRQILETEEAQRFFALKWNDRRYYGINLLAATTGMRLGEIRGLQADDIKEDYIHVCHNWQDTEPEGRKMKGPKHSTLANRKERDVPFPPRLAPVLRELIKRNPWNDGFVIWGNSQGKPLSESIILRHFYEGLQAIGIGPEERERRKLNFHAWRHFYNTNIRPYVPDYQLRMLTGHTSEAMTERYTEITTEQRRAVAMIADGLFTSRPGLARNRNSQIGAGKDGGKKAALRTLGQASR